MKTAKECAYLLYKQFSSNTAAATFASYLYVRLWLWLWLRFRKKNPPAREYAASGKKPKIAFVCDEMTWQDFRGECEAVFVSPHRWRETLEAEKPDIFFCESAWSGIEASRGVWRGQIYRNRRVIYNNRRALLRILDYCRAKGIPTVFWNKEDPAFFGDETYNFVDTALHFDHIFTTAAECVPNYQALGHKSVRLLQFGFSPGIFYPPEREGFRENTAVFAGSWYDDQPERCRDMTDVFNMVLREGIALVIYDRQSASSNPVNRFPPEFQCYIKPGVAFARLGEIYRRSRYGININTVTDSTTMFARRVFELMACGCIVVSNRSDGLEKMFPERVWIAERPFERGAEDEIRAQNLMDVQNRHTCERRMCEIISAIE